MGSDIPYLKLMICHAERVGVLSHKLEVNYQPKAANSCAGIASYRLDPIKPGGQSYFVRLTYRNPVVYEKLVNRQMCMRIGRSA